MYKVLIAAASPEELNTMSGIIQWEDCGLQIVGQLSDGADTLLFLEQHPVDILIMDVQLPHMDGIAVLRELRSREQHTHCILLSAQAYFTRVQEAAPLGIENFLLQPVDPQLLLDTLLGTVQKIAQERQKLAASGMGLPVYSGRSYPPMLINHTFEKHMINQDYAQGFACLDNLFADAAEEAAPTLRNQVLELMVYTLNILRSCNVEVSDIVEDETKLFQTILASQSTQDLYTYAKGVLADSVKALESKNMRYSPCISRVVAHIEKNYAQDISLKTMAYELNINAAYLGQLFKTETGQLFSVYLNKTRIENAKKLLLKNNHSLSEVSVQCGYANISYFYNIFKKFTGQTPSQYRKAKTK